MADLILKGNFKTETNSLESTLIRHMQKETNFDAIPDTIATDKWTGKIKNWPEALQPPPLVCTYHTAKSSFHPMTLMKKDPNYDKVESQCDSLIQFKSTC